MHQSIKVRISKGSLAKLPAPLRPLVQEWRARYRRAFFTAVRTDGFYAAEDARVTLINLETGRSASVQAAGVFSGFTPLSPTAKIPLPPGVVAVEQGFFCGVPFLTIYEGVQQGPTTPQITN